GSTKHRRTARERHRRKRQTDRRSVTGGDQGGTMCFKNLPIEFDDGGKARLKAGVKDPYSVTVAEPKGYVRRKEGPGAQLAAPPRLRDWNIDPMTRVAGALAVHTVLDLENRRAVDAHSRAML